MSKTRFTTSDVKAMVRDIRSSILGQRVANIYNLTEKIYLFKFAVPGEAQKVFLLVESGMRFHTTKYTRDKNDMPSPFAMKLRKHIRLKRLEDIRQIGSDRVVDLKFGSGDSICHIILELYATGNIVLTDGNYEVLALLRSHKFEDDIAVQVGEIYPIAFTTTAGLTSSANSTAAATNDFHISSMDVSKFINWTELRHQDMIEQSDKQQKEKDENVLLASENTSKGGDKKTSSSKKQRVKKLNLRQLLLNNESGVALYGPEILDHCLLSSGLEPSMKVEDFLTDFKRGSGRVTSDIVTLLLNELQNTAPGLLALLDTPGQSGYILVKPPSSSSSASATSKKAGKGGKSGLDRVEEEEVKQSATPIPEGDFFDFVPRLYRQHEHDSTVIVKEFGSFDEAVDEYFCKVEEQKLQHHATAAEEAAKKKVKKVKDEMRNQLQGLVDTQLKMEKAACLTEAFSDEVDKACLVINSALGAGISWEDISTMVTAETAAGNPIASLISRLRLDKNRIVLRLPDILAESDEDEEDDESDDDESKSAISKSKLKKNFIEVDLDLSLSAYANASKLYSQRKTAKSKEEKTSIAAERAIKAAEQSSSKQLVNQQIKRNLQEQRKVHWFEKFNWFISSEGYLVLSGRDAQQNEQLVKKYLRVGDAYVHADMHGASSCIVRCKMKKDVITGSETPLPISPFALNEAGTMTICRSGAWGVKVVMSAWWVHANQVSKTAPTGEYLTTGSFMIYGKKNYLAPATLEMGFGILFRLDDGSVSRHLNDRVDKSFVIHNDDDVVDNREINMKYITASTLESEQEGKYVSQGELSKPPSKREGKVSQSAKESQTSNVEKEEVIREDTTTIVIEKEENDHDDDDSKSDSDTEEEVEEEEEEVEEMVKDRAGDTGSIDIIELPASFSSNEVKIVSKEDMEEKKENTNISKSKLSVYQRKLLKKGKTLEEIEAIQQSKQQKDKEDKGKKKTISESVEKEKDKSELSSLSQQNNIKKKKLGKKKARRYADQDEEDITLAMQALGHKLPSDQSEGSKASRVTSVTSRSSEDRARRQEKAGLHLLKSDWETAVAQLSEEVRAELTSLVEKKVIKEGELDSFELNTLASFTSQQAIEILNLFNCENATKIGNKTGFLAGIMRRYSKQKKSGGEEVVKENLEEEKPENSPDQIALSRRERKKNEAQEIQLILEEEGMLDELEGKQADELEKLSGLPHHLDTLLYAIPVCGPFSALKNFKYKVKLTPGTIKKGKACKNAIEVFVNSKNYTSSGGGSVVLDSGSSLLEATSNERTLIKGLSDPEMVAIMIGDVKLSMPGLYDTLKKKKETSKKKKTKE